MKLLPVLLFVFLSLPACGPVKTESTRKATPDNIARDLLVSGHYEAAAIEYQRLAQLYPKQADSFQLQAIDAYLEANQLEAAKELLQKTEPLQKDKTSRFHHTLLLAKHALFNNQPQQALYLLSNTTPEDIPLELINQRHDIRALAYEYLHNYLNAVRERMSRQKTLADIDAIHHNTVKLWQDLTELDNSQIEQLAHSNDTELRSWVELINIKNNLLLKPTQLEQALTAWASQYPEHPAIPTIISQLIALSDELNIQPESIALILPFSGPYKKASEAIRDGFIATWFNEEDYKPVIKIYDADALTINVAYHQAINEGANFVVGPLEKNAIKALLEQSPSLPVTTLTLNRIDENGSQGVLYDISSTAGSAQLFQFSLSPEDEARQAAQRGITEGKHRALIITPTNEWGARLGQAFAEEWQTQGGIVLEHVQYDPKTSDFINPVKNLLNVNSSESRISLLRQRLSRNLKSSSRVREDKDLIFMAGVPVAGRQLVPQFRFFQADNVSVYSSSYVYSGTRNSDLDADLNGIEFTDMPWVFSTKDNFSKTQLALNAGWSANTSPYTRLYAFGVDAFNLVSNLGLLLSQRQAGFSGATGQLYIGNNKTLYRKLNWAKFINGVPIPILSEND